ncbi:hypothetical protein [Aquimarina aquimarini]|uniref:hypothetical protein n=1 Tax=Aquimarina aquimarini TaxID=1191734 RepID=UPI000D55BC77|nr:hypothetical protein [Aquimarina aquimarini]
MRYLLISFCFLCVGCASYPKKNKFEKKETSDTFLRNTHFSDKTEDYIYKASIDIYKRHFGGILIIKKINDANHRVVFTTEMGNKIFDFSFIDNDFTVNHILDDFNKKILISILKKDFRTLIKENMKLTNTYSHHEDLVFETEIDKKKHYYYQTDNKISKIARVSNGKEKVVFTFSEINDTIANLITIEHKGIKLKISLKSI